MTRTAARSRVRFGVASGISITACKPALVLHTRAFSPSDDSPFASIDACSAASATWLCSGRESRTTSFNTALISRPPTSVAPRPAYGFRPASPATTNGTRARSAQAAPSSCADGTDLAKVRTVRATSTPSPSSGQALAPVKPLQGNAGIPASWHLTTECPSASNSAIAFFAEPGSASSTSTLIIAP